MRYWIGLLLLLRLAAPVAADEALPAASALIVIQGTLESADGQHLALTKVSEVLVLDDRQPAQVVRLDIAAFERALWGKTGPFASAAPQASLRATGLETLVLLSVTGAAVEDALLRIDYELDLGELPPVGTAVILTLAGPVSDDRAAASDGSQPLGMLDHNPLNIRPLSQPDRWDGQIGVYHTSDASFAMFEDYAYGLRAGADLLRNYQREHGLRTLLGPGGYGAQDGIITRWSPAFDHNDPKVYVARVSKLTGFKPDQVLDLEDGATVAKLLSAMTHVELGIEDDQPLPYGEADLQAALELAKFN